MECATPPANPAKAPHKSNQRNLDTAWNTTRNHCSESILDKLAASLLSGQNVLIAAHATIRL
jgi:hypothetical protein